MTYPPVIGEFQTVAELLTGKSLARFGDGEIKCADAQGYKREPGSEKLSTELCKIIRGKGHANCLVGIPTMSPAGPKYENWMRHEQRFLRFLRPDRVQYYSAFLSRPDSAPWIYTEEFAAEVEKLWRGRRVAVVCEPDNKILTAVEFTAKAVAHVPCPRWEAYAEIDSLERQVIEQRPHIALLSCGPTASCLANRLTRRKLQAIDIGSAGGWLVELLGKKT